MKKAKNKKNKTISQKITWAIVMIAICSSVIADIVANVSNELIHTMSMSGNQPSTGVEMIANMAKAQAQPNNNNIFMLIAIGAINIAFIAAFIFVAFKIGKRIAHYITEPINKMVEVANSIAEGDLEVDISYEAKDETGILIEAFKKIVSSLQLLKNDVHMLVDEAVEGRLDTRADLSRHYGDYREIIEGVNKTLDTVKAPLDVASEYITHLADGEHQEDIENTYKGYYATLIDNLNMVRESINILEDESENLANAGMNGNLDFRGDQTKLKGTYAKIIRGVNQTFDSIKEPLDVASEFISDLAEGKNKTAIDNIYKGYYSSLIDNLNDVRVSLRYLADESSKLTQAGLHGDLTVRGNTGVLKGDYAEIVDGFNNTLDYIVTPLNEAIEVVGKISLNDYTVEMSGEYKGSFAEFAKSINNTRSRLLMIQNDLILISKGDTSRLESYKKFGKYCENDKLTPAATSMTQTIRDVVEETNNVLSSVKNGDLSVRGNAEKFEGGFREIVNGLNETIRVIEKPFDDISVVLEQISNGDLTAEMTDSYKGEYNKIKVSINKAIDSFNNLLREINFSASQVSAGSRQVSDASQSLSQGATEQASLVEELTSSITEIAAQTKRNAASAAQASEISTAVKAEATQGNEKMAELLNSMTEINESSTNISKIIKVIDDIAFQTNILALNAAVEAARAGQYGKGFAVVAEEVRNLAGKSAQAAKETTALIEGSMGKVETGTKIANQTAGMLGKIVQSAQKSADLVSTIATASNDQATAISQIDKGVTQVSTVVQTNSATAQESAASSEQLSGQSEILMDMVQKFKLKNS